MEKISESIEAVCVPFSIDENRIHSDSELIKNVRRKVMFGDIVILKNVFTAKDMLDLRSKVISWGNENSLFPHGESPSKYPDLNYHRIDDGSVPSVCPHLFHQYAFNDIEKLQEKYAISFDHIAKKMTIIQNAIAETSFEISLTELRLKILQYPEGGGFLTEHTHPREPQQIGLILSLSRKESTFRKAQQHLKHRMGMLIRYIIMILEILLYSDTIYHMQLHQLTG
jgi:hypothetical protein